MTTHDQLKAKLAELTAEFSSQTWADFGLVIECLEDAAAMLDRVYAPGEREVVQNAIFDRLYATKEQS